MNTIICIIWNKIEDTAILNLAMIKRLYVGQKIRKKKIVKKFIKKLVMNIWQNNRKQIVKNMPILEETKTFMETFLFR